MKLTHQGLRASDRTYELGKLNLFRGPVGSGKSTALDAVGLVALGYVPRVGRSEAATRRLVSGERARVLLTMDDGRTIERELDRAAGTRAVCRLSWAPKAKLTEAQAAATALFGATQEEAEQNLDTRVLLMGSPRERATYVEAMLEGSGAVDARDLPRRMAARLAKLELSRVPDDRAAQRTLAGCPVFDEVADLASATLAKSGFALALEDAGTRKNAAANDARSKTAARGAIEDRKLAADAPAEAEDKLRARRDAATTAKAQAEAGLTAEAAQARQMTEAEAEIDNARFAVADAAKIDPVALRSKATALRAEAETIVDPAPPAAPAVAIPSDDVARQVAALREQAAAANAGGDKIVDPAIPARAEVDPAIRTEIESWHDRVDALVAEADRVVVPPLLGVDREQYALTEAKRAYERALKSPWSKVDGIAGQLVEIGIAYEDGVLPTLAGQLRDLAKEHGGDAEALAGLVTRAKQGLAAASESEVRRLAERQDAENRRAALRAEAAVLSAEAGAKWSAAVVEQTRAQDAADLAYATARAEASIRRNAHRTLAADLTTKANALAKADADRVSAENAKAQAEHTEARSAWALAVGANTYHRANRRTEADAAEAQARGADATRAAAAEALAAAEAKLAGIRAAVYDVPALKAAAAAALAEIAELDGKIKACGEAAARKREMAALVAEIDRADALRAAWAAAADALRELRDADVKRRAGPLEERMRVFLRGAGRAEEPYVRCEAGVTDFGWRTPSGAEVSLDGALSGGESVLMLTALATAVVGLRAPTLRVLLIEAAELHGEDAGSLLAGCEAVSDGFDAILVAGPASLPTRAGWVVSDIQQEAAAAA